MINIGVVGAAGKMGRMIIKAVAESHDSVLTAALEAENSPFIDKDAGTTAGIDPLNVNITASIDEFLKKSDVIIDFSSIKSTLKLLEQSKKQSKKTVIGTTGLSEPEINIIREASAAVPTVFSPNMSVGVNLLFNLAKVVTQAIGQKYDIEIIEAHHNQKKDSPSGTAKKIAEIIADTLGRNLDDTAVHGRVGHTGKRKPEEIGIHAVRAGDIVGEHTVIYASDGERIELTHKASSRTTFAKGAVTAAIWLNNIDKPGLYSMKDVLGF